MSGYLIVLLTNDDLLTVPVCRTYIYILTKMCVNNRG